MSSAMEAHYAIMPNSVARFRGVVRKRRTFWFGYRYKILLDVGWGQFANDKSATEMVAYYLWNNDMRDGWEFVSWEALMNDGKIVTGKGLPFKFSDYGLGL